MSRFSLSPKILFGAILSLLLVLYPICVYFGLSYLEPSMLGLILLVVLGIRYWYVSKRSPGLIGNTVKWSLLVGAVLAIATLMLNQKTTLMMYPVAVNLVFCGVFFLSLLRPPTIVERIARLRHAELSKEGIEYTRKVTIAWCLFFIANAAVSTYTAFFTSLQTWTLYNGLISYILIGMFFAGEFLIRLRKMRH